MTNTHFFDTEIRIGPRVEVLLEYSVALNYPWRVRSFALREQVEFEDGQQEMKISSLLISTLSPCWHFICIPGAWGYSRMGQVLFLSADLGQNFSKEAKRSSMFFSPHRSSLFFLFLFLYNYC